MMSSSTTQTPAADRPLPKADGEMYTLAELGITRDDLRGLNLMFTEQNGRDYFDPGVIPGVVMVRGWPYEVRNAGDLIYGAVKRCTYYDLRPLYTPREWHPRPHAYDWRDLPVPTPGGHQTGRNVRTPDGTPYVLGPADDSIEVITVGVDPFLAEQVVDRRYITAAGRWRGQMRLDAGRRARFARSRYVYFHGYAAERDALISRLATHYGVPADWCAGEVADMPMLTRRAAFSLPQIANEWAREDARAAASNPRRKQSKRRATARSEAA